MIGVVFVFCLNDNLRVVQLLQFRRKRKPETRTAAANESRKRYQCLTRLAGLLGNLLFILFHYLSYRFFCLFSSFIRRGERRIFRQPHIYIREMGQVFRKKLLFQLTHEKSAECEKDQRSRQHSPAMINCPRPDLVIKSREAFCTSFFYRRLALWLQQVIAQQRNK